MFAADFNVAQVIETSSCLNSGPTEGSADDMFFDFDPDANYDLLITAPKTSQPNAPEVVIQRSQFHTSRYASPRELLDAFAFTSGGPNASLPVEVLVDAPLPTTEQLGDAPFDATMVDLGLDPLGVALTPRVALLLHRQGTDYEVTGVLLEGPEPIHRAGRLVIQSAQIILGGGQIVTLNTVRRNDAGTRILLGVPTPTIIGSGSATMELVLRGTREPLQSGSRFITAYGPAIAEENGQ
jgi:hypothetical protein